MTCEILKNIASVGTIVYDKKWQTKKNCILSTATTNQFIKHKSRVNARILCVVNFDELSVSMIFRQLLRESSFAVIPLLVFELQSNAVFFMNTMTNPNDDAAD